ncbi:MAG: phosphotransferase [Rubrobacter sp.]|nr:phosphotransferase [Rubrobacter sp.]
MLLPADADLVRRDAALPGLSTLLDPEAFAARLARAVPDAGVEAARSTYVRYKPGTDCLASYRVTVAGEETRVHATAYKPDAHDKLRKARKPPETPGPLGVGRFVLEDLALSVSFFPNDKKLKALPQLHDADERRELLRSRLGGRRDLWEAGLEGIRYKPERRYVAQLLNGGARALLKVYTGDGYRAARTNAEAFTEAFKTRGPFRLAPLVGHSDRHRLLVFEWLPGRSLSEALLEPGLHPDELSTVGAALAELHSQEPGRLARPGRGDEAETLRAVACGIGHLSPHLAGLSGDLARLISGTLTGLPPAGRPIHGDFDAGQVLLSGETITLLDLDRAVRGDPAEDLGLFAAHLERGVLDGDLHPDRAESFREALLEGYRYSTGRPVPDRVGVYTAAGLLRMAPEPFRYRHPDWPRRTEEILIRAGEILRATSLRTTGAGRERRS